MNQSIGQLMGQIEKDRMRETVIDSAQADATYKRAQAASLDWNRRHPEVDYEIKAVVDPNSPEGFKFAKISKNQFGKDQMTDLTPTDKDTQIRGKDIYKDTPKDFLDYANLQQKANNLIFDSTADIAQRRSAISTANSIEMARTRDNPDFATNQFILRLPKPTSWWRGFFGNPEREFEMGDDVAIIMNLSEYTNKNGEPLNTQKFIELTKGKDTQAMLRKLLGE